MTQAESRLPVPPTMFSRPRNDVYTVLLITANLFVLTATAYLSYVCYSYYGTIVPLSSGG